MMVELYFSVVVGSATQNNVFKQTFSFFTGQLYVLSSPDPTFRARGSGVWDRRIPNLNPIRLNILILHVATSTFCT